MTKTPKQEISADEYQGLLSEAEWQRSIVNQAVAYGWIVLMEIPDKGLASLGALIDRGKKGQISRFPLKGLLALLASVSGWPDLTLGHPQMKRTICVEVKTNDGTVRPNQKAVLALLPRCGIETFVWKPKNAQQVGLVLSGVDKYGIVGYSRDREKEGQ